MSIDIGTRLARLERKVDTLQRSTRLGHSSLEDSAVPVYDAAGSLRAVIGQQSDGTTAVTITNGQAPPSPSTPSGVAVLGGVAVSWDGVFADGVFAPLDWSRVEVHASATDGFDPAPETLFGTLESPQGGTVTVPSTVPLFVRLVARNTSGAASAPSGQVGPVTPGVVTGAQLAEDAMDGKTITGTTVQTGESGRRLVLDPDALALLLYSGAASETAPGQLIADVTDGGMHPIPFAELDAPSVKPDGSGQAYLHLGSGGGPDNDQGNMELTTGDGSGGRTMLYAYASDGGANLGSMTLQVDEPTAGSGYLEVTADTLEWSPASGAGALFVDASGLSSAGPITAPGGTVTTQGPWTEVTSFGSTYWRHTDVGDSYQPLRYAGGNRRAYLDGAVTVATSYSGATPQVVCVLPPALRPLKSHYLTAEKISSGTPSNRLGLVINNSGVVSAYSSAALNVGDRYAFQLNWPLD